MDGASKAAKKPTRGEITRQKILDAAEQVFAEQSYAAARLEDVAQLVGIKRAAIVYYFRDKQELFDAVESGLYAALEAAIRSRLETATTHLDKLFALVDSSLEFLVERPSLAKLILRNIADSYPAASDPVRYSQSILRFWEEIVAAGQASGEFGPVNTMQLMQILGGSTLYFATTAELLGQGKQYNATDPAVLNEFRAILHKTAESLLEPSAQ
jgi:TetR/AcrR family transcriptional regulator